MAALSCDISVVKEGCSELGEGPHWDEKTQRIIWVDILGHSVHLLDPVTGKVRFNLVVRHGSWGNHIFKPTGYFEVA